MGVRQSVAIGVASSVGTLLLVAVLLAAGSGAALAQPGGDRLPAVTAQPAGGDPAVTDGGAAVASAPQSPPGSRLDEPTHPAQSVFSYYYVPGATLMPRNSTTGRNYSATGCSFTVNGTDRIMNTELQVPEGSVIKYLRIYYIDTDAAANVRGYLTRYESGIQTQDLAFVQSTGSSGFGTALSQEITHTVDNFNAAYVLIGWPEVSSSAVQVCGLRVAYYAPANLPLSITLPLSDATP